MKKIFLGFILLLQTVSAQAVLRIVTTTPELADLTLQVGGDRVSVKSLAKGTEDIHAVPQRPSFLPLLNQADGVVLLGMEVEHTFLPALLEVAQNPRILPGRPGYIDCSEDIIPMDVPHDLSRAHGELHPHGNPHYNMDPRQGALMVETIARGLSRLDPPNASFYARQSEAYKKQLTEKLREWHGWAAAMKGQKAISQHADMAYLADFLGLALAGTVEPKPGIAPSPRHLQEVAQTMKRENVRILIHETQYPKSTAQWLASQTGARIAEVATMGGAFADSKTYIGFIEHNLRALRGDLP